MSNLTWYESLLVARVHPVISVVTLTSTGLLCYAGHVCNYFQKTFEWFSELPSRIGNHSWFMIKRRRSINATASDTTQKKPTTANRHRLEAAFGELFEFMPNVYEGSRVDHDILAEYPAEREQEMLDPIEPDGDLTGEVTVSKEVFCEWLRTGSVSDACQCAIAVMRYATDLQGSDLRGAVDVETAWELCFRTLTAWLPPEATSIGSRTLSQFLVWLLDSNSLPSAFRDQIYAGMWDELESRGKVIQTDPDEDAMKVRWVKQRLHAEFDIAREMWFGRQSETPVDLDLLGGIDEAEQGSVTKEAEEVAAKFLKDLDYSWSPENSSGDAIAEKDAEIARAVLEKIS